MQDPVKELPSIINQLLQAPADRQRKLIERYFTPDCKITHALVSEPNMLTGGAPSLLLKCFNWSLLVYPLCRFLGTTGRR